MTKDTKYVLSKLRNYLEAFHKNGYSAKKAEEILSLLTEKSSSSFRSVLSSFGCSKFDAAALGLGLIVTVSRDAAAEISELSGAVPGNITPGVVSAVFFGYDDILHFMEDLMPYSPLTRLMTGVSPEYNARMKLRQLVVDHILNQSVYDSSFIFEEDADDRTLVDLVSQKKAVEELVSVIRGSDTSEPFIIQLTGDRGAGKMTCIREAFSRLQRRFIRISLSGDITSGEITELSSKLILSRSIPVITGVDQCRSFYEKVRSLSEEVGLVIIVSGRSGEKLSEGIDTIIIRLQPPTLEEQYLLWQSESKEYELEEGTDLSEISGEFDMSPGSVKKAFRFAGILSENKKLTVSDIKNGCYRSFDPDMGEKAVRLRRSFCWEDIVIPEQSRKLLIDACQQIRLRHKVLNDWGFSGKMPYGTGVSMIFTGPPGTGKTMAAQVMANELEMDIYKISLANVVSKYIGETEKNLNEIFDKARLCKGILFFDEADVLFSKRTEVKEANDKYSNMEAAFLLQKIEEYTGVVILATNLVQNFDEAFKRRMRFIIDFPFPDAELRRIIWQKAFPEKAPVDNIDLDFLVERFELSGSNIRNIAIHSAYLAAGENSSGIGMKHIMAAVRNEFAKSGKAFTRAEAGEYFFES